MKPGISSALLAALLFGISTPVIKMLLGGIGPLYLAGFLYIGSGIGLSLILLIRSHIFEKFLSGFPRESHLQGREYLWLAGSILCGGVLAPILLTVGLSFAAGSQASLLLNMESILTALVAFLLFKEAIGRRVWGVALMMLTGSLILSYEPSKSAILLSKGSLLVLGASFMWALDNNLTRSLSLKDPLSIAAIKGLAAGIVSACAAWYAGEKFPPAGGIAVTMTVGFFCYGASLVLFVYALRHLGTARTGAYFSLGPFIGAVASVILLKEPVTCQLAAAALVMGLGTCLLVREEHSHEHTHEPMWHDHRHSHNDGHHNHTHPEVPGNVEDHCHPHEHELLVHSHHHMPELHHRHSH